jgi:4-phosphopantoate--beta-alanine ligase
MIPENHPRAESLKIRELLNKGFEKGIVTKPGLIAHGRGEAFDYLIGERTIPPTIQAITAASASLLLSKNSVISVNGNVASLVPREIVTLSNLLDAKIEVNLFYRTLSRELLIMDTLKSFGANEILGVGKDASIEITEIKSMRQFVDPRGIYTADTVLVPLEDGDRAKVLGSMGKNIITIDLNPLSRTSKSANITIVDNIIRAMPLLIKEIRKLKTCDSYFLNTIVKDFDNEVNLKKCMSYIAENILKLSNR